MTLTCLNLRASGRVLICASDDRTCAQLKDYIQKGADSLLTRLYSRTVGKDDCVPLPEKTKQGKSCPRKEAGKVAKGKKPQAKNAKVGTKKQRASLTLTQMVEQQKEVEVEHMGSSGDEKEQDEKQEVKEEESILNLTSDSYYGVLQEPMTVIHPLKGCLDPYSLTRVLKEVEPMFVVLYDAELSFVRQLEVYKASRPGKPLRYHIVSIVSVHVFQHQWKILGLICKDFMSVPVVGCIFSFTAVPPRSRGISPLCVKRNKLLNI